MKYMVTYGVYIRLWPTLSMWQQPQHKLVDVALGVELLCITQGLTFLDLGLVFSRPLLRSGPGS